MTSTASKVPRWKSSEFEVKPLQVSVWRKLGPLMESVSGATPAQHLVAHVEIGAKGKAKSKSAKAPNKRKPGHVKPEAEAGQEVAQRRKA